MNAIIAQIQDPGWAIVNDVLSSETSEVCCATARTIATNCGIIAPSQLHNGNWQTRALELMDGTINPSRANNIFKEQFYIRPNVINDFQTFVPGLAHPHVLTIINSLIGADARITSTTLYVHEPGTHRGPWHASGPFNPDLLAHYPAPYKDAPLHLTLHMLFSDFTKENGGLLAIPRSHERTSNPAYTDTMDASPCTPDPNELVLTAKSGSVIILDSRTWQAIAPNNSDELRISTIIEYAPKSSLAKCSEISKILLKQLPYRTQSFLIGG